MSEQKLGMGTGWG